MKLFEICTADKDVRFSPFVWRVIMCLHHKGLSFERVPMTFLETGDMLKTDPKTVPVLEDGDRQIVDSFEIAKYLEETYPDKPFFGAEELTVRDETIRGAEGLNKWTNMTACMAMFHMLVKEIHDLQDEANQAYFRATREKRIGKSLEDMHAGRDDILPKFRASLQPLREKLKSAEYLSGAEPMWFDYCVFGAFQWARICSDYEMLEQDDPLHVWRERMLDLFGGVGRSAKLAY